MPTPTDHGGRRRHGVADPTAGGTRLGWSKPTELNRIESNRIAHCSGTVRHRATAAQLQKSTWVRAGRAVLFSLPLQLPPPGSPGAWAWQLPHTAPHVDHPGKLRDSHREPHCAAGPAQGVALSPQHKPQASCNRALVQARRVAIAGSGSCSAAVHEHSRIRKVYATAQSAAPPTTSRQRQRHHQHVARQLPPTTTTTGATATRHPPCPPLDR